MQSGEKKMGTRYRVLSLDGGGSWALIEAKALINIFGAETSGWDVLRQFDLAAANSGGSIVLGCLIENFTLGQVLDFFLDESKRRSVFAATSSIGDKILESLLKMGPKYSAEKKLTALQGVLATKGNKSLGEAVKGLAGQRGSGDDLHVLIVGFDYDRCRAAFFRSKQTSGPAYGTGFPADLTLAEAIHASSNAPVNYFDGPAIYSSNPDRYWDGGITGNNNPVLVGVTEAVTATKEFTEIVALSLGTGTVALPWPQPGEEGSPYVRQRSGLGLKSDLAKLAGSILDDPPDLASFLAHVMTGGGSGVAKGGVADSQIVRMSPLICPVRDAASNQWVPPGGLTPEQFHAISTLDMDALAQSDVEMIADYADLWLKDQVPNMPVRMDGDNLTPEIGQGTFSKARAAWDEIKG
jgi:hypothetical protein